MNDNDPTDRELAAALGHKKLGRIQVAPVEDRTWIAPDGKAIVFDSAHEMNHYLKFVALEKFGAITELRRQVKYDLHAVTPNGFKVKVGAYVADIVCKDREGKVCVYDPKGHADKTYKLKKKMVEAEYGLRIVEL